MFFANVIVFCFVILTQYKSAQSDCSVPITSFIDILPTSRNGNNILYPYPNGNGDIVNDDGYSITLACPGDKIVPKKNKNVKFNIEFSEFVCTNGEYKSKDSQLKKYNINQLTCAALRPVEKIEKKEGFCEEITNAERVVIGFQFKDKKKFITQIEVCWNNKKKTALYALATIKYIPNRWEAQADRPFFRPGELFEKDLEKYYTRHFQLYNLCMSLGSIPKFKEPDNSFLVKGHLVANADFPYDAQQGLTFQYINAAPQWTSFNKGNWKKVEKQIIKYVFTRQSDLDVYTGTSGIFKMEKRTYYLDETKPQKQIPVPKYFWKIVLKKTETGTYSGVAILGLNDIQLQSEDIFNLPSESTELCPNIMTEIKNWLDIPIPIPGEERLGYVIACEIKEFEKIPELKKVLPTLPVPSDEIDLLK